MKELTYDDLKKENERLKQELLKDNLDKFFEKSSAIMLKVNVETKKLKRQTRLWLIFTDILKMILQIKK